MSTPRIRLDNCPGDGVAYGGGFCKGCENCVESVSSDDDSGPFAENFEDVDGYDDNDEDP